MHFKVYFCLSLQQDYLELLGIKVEEREGDRIRKGPWPGIWTWDTQSTTALYVGTLPTRLSVLTFCNNFDYNGNYIIMIFSYVHIYLDTDTIFIIVALYATRTELKIKQ